MYTQMEEESNWHWREPAQLRENGTSTKNKKTRNHHPLVIRVFNVLGSATLPNVRTPYLRLRLPVIIRRVQRGEAKLVVNTAKLGEFLDLSPENIDRLAPLLPRPLPEETRPTRKKVDYVTLRAQYQQLLSDGTCGIKAEVARHLGVRRIWVSRVLKGIKRKMG
jgi:hypothetical protein